MDLKWTHWSPKLVNDVLPEVSEGHVMDPSPAWFWDADIPVRYRRSGGPGGEIHKSELRCGSSLVPVVESADLGELDDVAHVWRVDRSWFRAVHVQRQVRS